MTDTSQNPATRDSSAQRDNAVCLHPEFADLRAIVEGTAVDTGELFFQSLVEHFANVLKVSYAFVAEFDGPDRVRTLAFWSKDHIAPNIGWELKGTPCEEVLKGALCHHPQQVARLFPDDKPLKELGIESYLGVPIREESGEILGHLAVFDERPLPEDPRLVLLLKIFAARATAELRRVHAEKRLRESEQRLRDLYEEAPIAYVQEGLDSRFISANRAAMNILGIKPEEVPGTVGMSFIPNTPEAQRRVHDAFKSVGQGTNTSGVVLELRRKDNGKPIWIQWWSKPDSSGKFTRTMFVDITDRVLMERENTRLAQQNLYLQEEIKSVHNFEEIVGRSSTLVSVLDNVRQVAPTSSTVLVLGETGTGKELIARAVHFASPRRDKPLIKINCASLPTGLVESELFGHERGAFSGAIAKRIGRFELANGGTIFLDEIGEIPLDTQAKLLRVLQEQEFDRVGGNAPIKVDVRVIAATNRNLAQAVKDGTFRADLFYRLNVFPLLLPPLRERRDDIPLLVQFLIAKFAARIGKSMSGVSDATMRRLLDYAWPGNVRELENVLERAVILAQGPVIDIDRSAFAPSSVPAESLVTTKNNDRTLDSIEKNHMIQVLRESDWIIEGPRGAADVLGLHPNTLRSRLKKLGISRETHGGS